MLFTIPLLDIKECYSEKRGLGGNAPNKLKASAAGKGSELASDPCRRHSQKLVDCKLAKIFSVPLINC